MDTHASGHFRYEIVPAGSWFATPGTTSVQAVDVARPHFIPTTEAACRMVEEDGPRRRYTVYTKGVVLVDGVHVPAYRFAENLGTEKIGLILWALNSVMREILDED